MRKGRCHCARPSHLRRFDGTIAFRAKKFQESGTTISIKLTLVATCRSRSAWIDISKPNPHLRSGLSQFSLHCTGLRRIL